MTVNGAVPVAIVDTKTPAVPKLPTLALPETLNVVNVPVDVILGCALVVTVPAVVAEPAVATLKLATCVVDVTTNGAVPVANVVMY